MSEQISDYSPLKEPQTAPRPAPPRSPWLLKIGAEALLLSVGVFLALMGDQWRENARNQELAQDALRRFRAEIRTNREAVASVEDTRVIKFNNLMAYLKAVETPNKLPVPENSTSPAFLQHAAWDLALATGSLAHIDRDLAFSISRLYASQESLDFLSRSITQSMYSISDVNTWLQNLATYFGDCILHEPRLLKAYDEILPQIDRALGE
jgi:hypothetical protein